VLFFGLSKAQLRTGWGGDLLVDPFAALPLWLPVGGMTLSGMIPPDEALCGLAVYLQMLQSDPGATEQIAFSPGLELVFGR
jgi:hypothetical protein